VKVPGSGQNFHCWKTASGRNVKTDPVITGIG
jgi:hypothetical protein